MWDLIVSVPDHCLSFYFVSDRTAFSGKVSSSSKRFNQQHLFFGTFSLFASIFFSLHQFVLSLTTNIVKSLL